MRKAQVTIAQLLIIVLLAALICCGYTLRLRSERFYSIALQHQSKRKTYDVNFYVLRGIVYGRNRIRMAPKGNRLHEPGVASSIGMFEDSIHYEESMYRKYRRAARYPWIALDPIDPPEPPPPEWPWKPNP